MLQEIINRRSIRKFKPMEVPRPLIEEVLKAASLAPSSKNRQPWKFIVVMGEAKKQMLDVMKKGLEREKITPLLPDSAQYLSGAEQTLHTMAQAPVTIFVVNPLGLDLSCELSTDARVFELCNAQSIGAAMENMSLTATELGLGSLWICDTYFAYEELSHWLDTEGEFFAAMALGYADEAPKARPRKEMMDIVEWRN